MNFDSPAVYFDDSFGRSRVRPPGFGGGRTSRNAPFCRRGVDWFFFEFGRA